MMLSCILNHGQSKYLTLGTRSKRADCPRPKLFIFRKDQMAYYDLSTKKWSQIVSTKILIDYYQFSFDGLSTMIFSHADILEPYSLSGSYGPGQYTTSKSILTMVLDETNPSTVQFKFHPIAPFALLDGVGLKPGSYSAYDPLRKRLYMAVSKSMRYVKFVLNRNIRGDTTIRPAIFFHTCLLLIWTQRPPRKEKPGYSWDLARQSMAFAQSSLTQHLKAANHLLPHLLRQAKARKYLYHWSHQQGRLLRAPNQRPQCQWLQLPKR
jgi:hypothetical protein